MKASQYDKWYNDKPDVYALLYTYDSKKTKQVTALCKKNSFFIELARMSAGSKLATAINKVLQPNTATPQTATK